MKEIINQWVYKDLTVVLKKTNDPIRIANNQEYYLVVNGQVKYPSANDGVRSEALAMTWAALNGWAQPHVYKEDTMGKTPQMPDGIKLNTMQAQAYEAIVNGTENILLTGNAGTGKSFLTNLVVDALKAQGKNVLVTATTGIAGTHINGKTYHSALRILPKHKGADGKPMSLPDMVLETVADMTRRRGFVDWLKKIDVVFVDEVSMMSPYDFARIDRALRDVLGRPNVPFGGLRFVFVGDFLQIEPVEKRKNSLYSFAFQTNIWKENNIRTIQLTEVVRQQDAMFAAFLNNLRQGIWTPRMQKVVDAHTVRPDTVIPDGTVQFTPKNAECDEINARELAKIQGEEREYIAEDSNPDRFDFATRGWVEDKEYWDKNCLAPSVLRLKVGAQVMILQNGPEGGVVNGDTGYVTDMDDNVVIVYIHRLQGRYRFFAVTFHQETVSGDEEPRYYRRQLPLKTAWAVTIHKSQGMTLNSAVVHAREIFTAGQMYVAFSRVRSLEGLFIESFDSTKVSAHKDALEFYGLKGNLTGPEAEEVCHMRKLEDGNDNGGGGGVAPIPPKPTNSGGGGKTTPTPTKKGAPMSTKPIPTPTPTVVQPVQTFATVDKTPSGGGTMKEYLVEMTINGARSISRMVTNEPEYWLQADNAVVIEEVNRGGYHYALLEHMFGKISMAMTMTSFTDPMTGKGQMVFVRSSALPNDYVFGWANFDAETIIRVKGHGKKGESNLSEFGLHVANSEKMTKRLVEIARAARGYKVNTKANGDRMLKILVLTHDQILKAFPKLENNLNAEKTFDGVSIMAVEKAKDVYRNNTHMPKRSMAKLLNQIDNLEVTNHTLRVLTNIDGVAGEIKGNVLTGKRSAINARLVELGLSDGKVSYDIVTSSDNFKKELGTDGTWEIITLEPHHGPGMVKTNDQTMAQFAGIKGIFDFQEILEAFQSVLDGIKNNLMEGKDVEWLSTVRSERAVTESDTFNQLRSSMNTSLMHMYEVLNDLGLDIGVSQTLTHMRLTFFKKMFLSQETKPNWQASSKEKKSFMYMPYAYRAYAMTKEVIYLAGYDIDLDDENSFYHEETQTFAMCGKLWAEVCLKLGGADLDDEIMVHVRKLIDLDGSMRLVALLIRTPNDWNEYAIVDIDDFGPVFVDDGDLPTVDAKDLVKFQQSSVTGQLPSKVNGSKRPKPAVWNYNCARYNYRISGLIPGRVGGQVKTKMIRYAVYNSPFPTLPCANEDMIDAIQQCKGDADDLKTLNNWSNTETAALLMGKPMDAYWFYSRNMYAAAKAMNLNNTTAPLSPTNSPIVRDLMIPREEMIMETYEELDVFLKRTICEIEEINNVFKNKQEELRYRELVSKIINEQFDTRKMSKQEQTDLLNASATDILNRFIAFEQNNGIEATNIHMLRMARASYLIKKDRLGKNWDKWLYTVVPNSDLQIIDFFHRAMKWYRKQNNKP